MAGCLAWLACTIIDSFASYSDLKKKSIRCTLEFLNKKRIDFGQGLDFLNFSIRHFEIEGLTSYLNNSHLILLAYNIQPHERVKKNKKDTTYITFFFAQVIFFSIFWPPVAKVLHFSFQIRILHSKKSDPEPDSQVWIRKSIFQNDAIYF